MTPFVRRIAGSAAGVLTLVVGLASTVGAQQTVFNVPSADVLARGATYVETDHYLRREREPGASPGLFIVRGVVGLGAEVEAGVNVGGFEYRHESQPFLDAAIKWRALERSFGEADGAGRAGIVTGSNFGVGLRGAARGNVRDITYAAAYVSLPAARTRLSAGPYVATRDVFTNESRAGAQMTFEQPVPGVNGVVVAADWYTGDGGAVTTGFVWTLGRAIAYAAFGFANTGPSADVVTLELGMTF